MTQDQIDQLDQLIDKADDFVKVIGLLTLIAHRQENRKPQDASKWHGVIRGLAEASTAAKGFGLEFVRK
jgi:hypothetical protein